MKDKRICIVAILKNEQPFLDEWLFYHRLLGVDHFFLYDDDPCFPLNSFLKHHIAYVTIINWHGQDKNIPGKSNQTKAYEHATLNYIKEYEWVAFIDGDEFIVLPAWEDNMTKFLDEFDNAHSVSLNWHVFGHNGYYEYPEGLITASLTRRMNIPSSNIKTISRTKNILSIDSAHFCRLRSGQRVDTNHKRYTDDDMYEGKSARAHINHYQCRCFKHWMARFDRGDVSLGTKAISDAQMWRYDENLLLKKFVESIALDKNEYIDEYMLKFKSYLEKEIARLKLL